MNLSEKRNRRIYFSFLFLTSTFFLIINVETGILLFAVSASLSPFHQNTLFPLTYFLSVFSFLISLYWFRYDGILSIPLSIGVPFLWVTFFEVLWQNSFLLTGKFSDNLNSELILLSWLLMGSISFPKWKKDRVTISAFIAFSIGWIAWLGMGYPQMPSFLGYLFNISLKIGAFALIIILVMTKNSTSQTKRLYAGIGD